MKRRDQVGFRRFPPPRSLPDFFPIVTTFCFGMFWDRPGLALRDRSLATVSMLAALGRQDELRAHLMGARNLGISKEELVEVLMQVAVYAGVPIALAALNTAAQVLAEPKPEASERAVSADRRQPERRPLRGRRTHRLRRPPGVEPWGRQLRPHTGNFPARHLASLPVGETTRIAPNRPISLVTLR